MNDKTHNLKTLKECKEIWNKWISELDEEEKQKINDIAEKNTRRNELGQVVIPVDDEWRNEDYWDTLYEIKNNKR